MRLTLLALLSFASGCTQHHDIRTPPSDSGNANGDTDTDADSDTDTDADSDTDTDTDTIQDTGGPAPIGIDVSHWDGTPDWPTVAGEGGMAFAIVKASEGTYYLSSAFAQEYNGSYDAGMIHGAYHFAIPDDSDGATQADYFVDNGGGWSADGYTLPGALDIEYNPYGSTCYGLSKSDMAAWVKDFTDEYRARTTRDALIYSTADWWNTCVGSTAFGSTNPMWVADYGSGSPAMPTGWDLYTFWQYTSSASVAGMDPGVDQSVFNGDAYRLKMLAIGP